jgi:hypothetical protein
MKKILFLSFLLASQLCFAKDEGWLMEASLGWGAGDFKAGYSDDISLEIGVNADKPLFILLGGIPGGNYFGEYLLLSGYSYTFNNYIKIITKAGLSEWGLTVKSEDYPSKHYSSIDPVFSVGLYISPSEKKYDYFVSYIVRPHKFGYYNTAQIGIRLLTF